MMAIFFIYKTVNHLQTHCLSIHFQITVLCTKSLPSSRWRIVHTTLNALRSFLWEAYSLPSRSFKWHSYLPYFKPDIWFWTPNFMDQMVCCKRLALSTQNSANNKTLVLVCFQSSTGDNRGGTLQRFGQSTPNHPELTWSREGNTTLVRLITNTILISCQEFNLGST